MGLFSGRPEQRYNGFTAQFPSPPIPPNSASGSSYSLANAENSLRKIAIWSSVALIAGLAAELPFAVFASSSDNDKTPIGTPGYLDDIAGDGYGTADWIYSALVSFLLRGNVYGKVTARDSRGGWPTAIPLYHPDEVRGYRDNDGLAVWRINGIAVDAAELYHRRAFTMPGALLGLSPVGYQAMTIGLGLSAQQFGLEFFEEGANPTGILTNTETEINAEVAKTAKERFVAALNGTREPIVMGKGWTWNQISIAPEESQFLVTQEYTDAQCARIFGPGMAEVLGYDSGSNMTYANVEQRNIHLLTYCLDPWFSRIERMLSGFLPRPHYVRINRNALFRTDLLTRYKAHATAIAAHIMAPSEARFIEDKPPLTPDQLAELDKVAPVALAPMQVTPQTK